MSGPVPGSGEGEPSKTVRFLYSQTWEGVTDNKSKRMNKQAHFREQWCCGEHKLCVVVASASRGEAKGEQLSGCATMELRWGLNPWAGTRTQSEPTIF